MPNNDTRCAQYKAAIYSQYKNKQLSLDDVLRLPEIGLENAELVALQSAKEWARNELIKAIEARGNIRIIKEIPFSDDPSDYPLQLNDYVGDECTVVFLDVETTGLSHDTDKLIELGLVKLKYSPSKKLITSIDLVVSEYQDPGILIPHEISELTGITNKDTDGKKIKLDSIQSWLESEDTYVIAHNARFDRPFFTQLMESENYRWGCSASQIEWKRYKEYKIESAKLEYILLKLGYFYTGHRASIDCLAMVQMFVALPQALAELIDRVEEDSTLIEATGSPFEMKDDLKAAGYRWNPDRKVWSIEVPKSVSIEKLMELDSFSKHYNSAQATLTDISARKRFKKTKSTR